MNYDEIIEFVKGLNVGKKKLGVYIMNHYKDIYDEIFELTRFLDDTNYKNDDISFAERMYCINNHIYNRPTCIECGKGVFYKKDTQCYRDFCSSECSRSSKRTKQKRENTMMVKYGDPNYHNGDKARKTRETKNNGKWHSDNFGSKVKKTKFDRYGDENWSNEEQRKKTCLKKYGVMHPLELKDIQDKCRQSFLNNHPGMNSSFDIPGMRQKTSKGIRERSWKFITNNSLVEPLFSKDDYMNCDNPAKTIFKFKCKKCGNEFDSCWDNGTADLCEKCHPGLKGTSESEIEIFNMIKSHVKCGWKVYNREEINKSIIPPKEIDIVICDENDNIKLLVEYDGLYFHNDKLLSKHNHKYHINKTEECENKGYKLIHIFENEWLSKRNIVESRLFDNLGCYSNTIYARECEVKIVNDNDKDSFLISNHLQGTCSSKYNYGLYYKDELISLMTFGKPRFTRNNDFELLRFCNKLGYHVPGGASRLLKHFENDIKPDSMISYADRRWSNGNLYRKLGFVEDHKSRPDYWYFKPNSQSILYNRMRFQKYRLKKILEKYDSSKTEVENMFDNGYLRIFDCGNLVFIKKYDNNDSKQN